MRQRRRLRRIADIRKKNSRYRRGNYGKSNNRVLNELLVNLFHNVMDAEAKAVITDEFKDITNNDMHILEAIGIEEPKSMSRIAGELHVTVGTLTTNMNSLERKGYLTRNRSTRDKRVVLVTLTEKGRKAFSITEISTGK